jgi:hypothetical protein
VDAIARFRTVVSLWMRFCWEVIISKVGWVIETPVRWLYEIYEGVNWWALLCVVLISYCMKSFRGPFGVATAEEFSEPLYILMIPSS